ncbi:DUF4410 domain-containing protein [Candidatus Neomarinimicrobiota bacterium]
MKKTLKFIPIILAVIIVGCAAPVSYVATPAEPLTRYLSLEIDPIQSEVIGQVNQAILDEIMTGAVKDIIATNRFDEIRLVDDRLRKQLSRPVIVDSLSTAGDNIAVLLPVLLDYNKGNALLRFLFGFMAGAGNVKFELKVLDKTTGLELVRAETAAAIAGAYASEQVVVIPLSKAIAKFVEQSF